MVNDLTCGRTKPHSSSDDLVSSLMHINMGNEAGSKERECFDFIGASVMAETSKLPVKTQKASAALLETWRPFESLRREIDRLFDDFGGGRWPRLSSRSLSDIVPRSGEAWAAPAVDFVETEKSYEVTAELPKEH
jgi:hypothetical protein